MDCAEMQIDRWAGRLVSLLRSWQTSSTGRCLALGPRLTEHRRRSSLTSSKDIGSWVSPRSRQMTFAGWWAMALQILECSTWLLKASVDLLAPFITMMFNTFMFSGVFPAHYSETYVTPCLKNLSRPSEDPSSYQLVSNLTTLSKLLERVVSIQLVGYLTSACLLPRHQLAYRKFHSTETALLEAFT